MTPDQLRLAMQAEARLYLDTPWHHQGRMRGVGVDCVGVIANIGLKFGQVERDKTDYPMLPDGITLMRLLDENFTRISRKPLVMDIGVWVVGQKRVWSHVGLFTDIGILHSERGVKKVVEHELDDDWRNRFVQAYAFKDLV